MRTRIAGAFTVLATQPYRFVKEIGGVCLALNSRDEGSLGAGQAGPVQAFEPGVQLDLASPSVPKALTGVQLQQLVHQVFALWRHLFIFWPDQLPIQNAAEDLLQHM